MKNLKLNELEVGEGAPLCLIGGPCVIENEAISLETASALKRLTEALGIGFVFKSSYTKDNRSSAEYYPGPGPDEGLTILERVRTDVGVPVLSDVHHPEQAERAASVLDILQLPAFLCMQTSLALALGRTGKPVNVKKGQFLAPEDLKHVIGKIESTGNRQILLTERGTSFGYHDLVVDMKSFQIMKDLGYPTVFDVTHSVRVYGVPSADARGGRPEFVATLARAGVAAGADAVFIETHPEPGKALCDASSMIPLDKMEGLLTILRDLHALVHGL
jgi:2-dehydro-3-deoxyphosphooctonate aldolase (KDO 8-P synthase)